MPSALLPAPPRRTTGVPGSFRLEADTSTRLLDGGSVVLGGSPLRVFRLSGRAGPLVARWNEGGPVGDTPGAGVLARRLVSAGALTPRPTTAQLGWRDVTVVVPVRDRPAELDRLLCALG